jgi:hypothetical protein
MFRPYGLSWAGAIIWETGVEYTNGEGERDKSISPDDPACHAANKWKKNSSMLARSRRRIEASYRSCAYALISILLIQT